MTPYYTKEQVNELILDNRYRTNLVMENGFLTLKLRGKSDVEIAALETFMNKTYPGYVHSLQYRINEETKEFSIFYLPIYCKQNMLLEGFEVVTDNMATGILAGYRNWYQLIYNNVRFLSNPRNRDCKVFKINQGELLVYTVNTKDLVQVRELLANKDVYNGTDY